MPCNFKLAAIVGAAAANAAASCHLAFDGLGAVQRTHLARAAIAKPFRVPAAIYGLAFAAFVPRMSMLLVGELVRCWLGFLPAALHLHARSLVRGFGCERIPVSLQHFASFQFYYSAGHFIGTRNAHTDLCFACVLVFAGVREAAKRSSESLMRFPNCTRQMAARISGVKVLDMLQRAYIYPSPTPAKLNTYSLASHRLALVPGNTTSLSYHCKKICMRFVRQQSCNCAIKTSG